MKKFKKIMAGILSGCLVTMFINIAVFADEARTAIMQEVKPDEPGYGEFISDYVNQIIDYLSIYAVEGTTQLTLYKAGLLELLKNHPECYEEVMCAILGSIDEHSVFYDDGAFEEFISALESSVGGIGITFSEIGENLIVGTVYEGSPAAKAGIQPGDILYSADDKSLVGVNVNAAQNALRGEIGSTVVVGVLREGAEEAIYFTIVREEIAVKESVAYKIFSSKNTTAAKNEDIMYIRIYTFMDNTADLFGNAMQEADSKNINNIIIDVRDNGGGYINQAAAVANYFVPEGKPIVTEDHKIDMFDIVYTSNNKRTQNNDVVILVNENSASASEILTAALMENEVGVSIGTKTYGKGTVQSMVSLKDDEAMKYTSAYYLTPLGNNIDGVGIIPDAVVENGSIPFDYSDYSDFSYAGILSRGITSDEVIKAKKILSVWGMYTGDVNNAYFDSTLESAIISFQSQVDLFPYGVLDLTTQKALYNELSKTTVPVDDQLEAAFNHFGESYFD